MEQVALSGGQSGSECVEYSLKSPRTIAKELHVKHSTVEYFLKSADRHSTIY